MSTWPPPPPPAPVAGPPPPSHPGLPPFAWWAPFVALVVAYSAAIVAYILIASLAVGPRKLADADAGDVPSGVTLGATFVQDLLLLATAFVFARVSGARATPEAFGLRRIPVTRGVVQAAFAFAAFYVFLVSWGALLDVEDSDDLAAELGARDSTLSLIAVTVLVTVLAPIVEEIFFRGFLFPALWRWKGWVVGAVASGFTFGLVHAGGTEAVFLVPLAVLGFLLCWLYRRTGSLLPGMGVHAFNNALALGVTLSWEPWQVLLAILLAPAVVVALAAWVAAPREPA